MRKEREIERKKAAAERKKRERAEKQAHEEMLQQEQEDMARAVHLNVQMAKRAEREREVAQTCLESAPRPSTDQLFT